MIKPVYNQLINDHVLSFFFFLAYSSKKLLKVLSPMLCLGHFDMERIPPPENAS